MRRINPVGLWIVSASLVLAPSFGVGLAVVESRNNNSVIQEPLEQVYSEKARSSHAPSRSYSAEDRAAFLTLKQVESLQQEVSELRGLVETQEHEIARLKKSQQDFYLDLDKRLTQVQQGGPKPADKSKRTSIYAKSPDKLETKSEAKREAAPKQPSTKMVSEEKQIGTIPTLPPKALPVDAKEAVSLSEPIAVPYVALKEKEAYEAAYQLVRSKQYTEAVKSFQNYLSQYAKAEHAPNAYYWLGEVYMVQWQANKADTTLLEKASKSFLSLTTEFPAHAKAIDALLKLGIIENEKGNVEAAKKYLSEVKNHHPGTAAARIAETRLQQLN